MRRRRRKYRNKYMSANESGSYRFMIPIVCALGALVLAVALGTILRGVAESGSDEGSLEEKYKDYKNSVSDLYKGEVLMTPDNLCCAVYSVEIDNLTESDINSIKDVGYTALSFNLKNPDGSLTFNSTAASLLGGSGYGIDLQGTVTALREMGLSSTGVFYSRALDKTGADGKAAEAMESAVIGEAGLCGVDEIVLMGIDHKWSSDAEVERIMTFLGTLRSNTDSALILSFPYRLLEAEGAGEYLTFVSKCVDGIAIDLSGYTFPSDEESVLLDDLKQMGVAYLLERYNVRLLIPEAESRSLELLLFAGYTNIATIN